MTDVTVPANHDLVEITAEIISAYVSHNALSPTDLPKLVAEVHAALMGTAAALTAVEVEDELRPAVPIRKSITPDFIICLEDGKKFKSLKRHLRTNFDMSPEQYRAKWKLPADYPMVAPSYSAIRSTLARSNGLGRKRSEPARKPRRTARAG